MTWFPCPVCGTVPPRAATPPDPAPRSSGRPEASAPLGRPAGAAAPRLSPLLRAALPQLLTAGRQWAEAADQTQLDALSRSLVPWGAPALARVAGAVLAALDAAKSAQERS